MESTHENGSQVDLVGVTVALTTDHGGARVVVVRGEIDMAGAAPLWACLEAALATRGRIVIDLAGVTFMDSTGVNLIVRAHRLARKNANSVVLRSPSPEIRKVLAITGIDKLVTIEDQAAPTESAAAHGLG